MLEIEFHEMAKKENTHWWFVGRRTIIDNFLKKFLLNNISEILEIGCGTGSNINLLNKYGNLSVLEPSKVAVEYLRNKNFNIKNLKIGHCPKSLDYQNQFNLICLFDVLEHINEDAETIKKAANILNKDGYIFITVPAYQWLWSDHDVRLMHKRRYNLKEITKIIPNNLSIEYSTYFNTFLFPLAVIERLFRKMYKINDKSNNFLINFLFKHIFKLEKYFLKYVNFPFGLSILIILKKIN